MTPDPEIITFDRTGTAILHRSSRARYIRIVVREDSTVRVIVPRHATFRQARKFLLSQTEWVNKHLDLMKEQETSLSAKIRLPEVSDREEAQRSLTRQLRRLSLKFDLPFNRVTFRNQKTIWGSCSKENNISLNYKISLLPRHLKNYILTHELVHTLIKNHGSEFWSSLEAKIKGTGELRRELQNYRF